MRRDSIAEVARRLSLDVRVLLLAFAVWLPPAFLGYGTDRDSHRVIGTAKILLSEHRYVPSRGPGNPTHEFFSTALYAIHPTLLTNLGTLVMALVALWSFLRVLSLIHI